MEGALVDAVEAGFIAADEVRRGGIGKGGEGVGEAIEGVAIGLGGEALLEGAGLHGPGAAHPPVGGGHFLDETELHAIGGLEAFDELR